MWFQILVSTKSLHNPCLNWTSSALRRKQPATATLPTPIRQSHTHQKLGKKTENSGRQQPSLCILHSGGHSHLAAISDQSSISYKVIMGPRWKGKGSEAKSVANPMSKTISDLQSSLIKSKSQGILSDSSVLLPTNPDQTDLLNQSCFGRPIITVDKDKQWFQLTLEEAFYLSFSLNCIKIVTGNNIIKTNTELWDYMVSKRVSFPDFFKAYSHLRAKNWVVRSGCQYGVDFVAYCHHPSLVHSEYGVLVFSEGDRNGNDRLRVWSDFQCTLRLSGSVAKTLLILYVNRNGESGIDSPCCLGNYSVEERTITRWNPERCREDQSGVEIGTK